MSTATPDAPDRHPHDKPHHPHWPLACALFAAVFFLGELSIHDPATWIHIRTGQLILARGALPHADPFSYTASGRPWTTSSWLADCLFYLVHEALGPRGLIALKSAVVAGAFSLLLPLNPASPLTAAGLLGLGAAASWGGLAELPGVFDLLCLALLLRLLRPRRRLGAGTVAAAAGVEWLWANLHGPTAVLGVWLALLKAFKGCLRSGQRRERWEHGALFAAVAAALALNPLGPGVSAGLFGGGQAAWPALSPGGAFYVLFCLAGSAACMVTLQQEFLLTMTAATILGLSLFSPALRPLAMLASCPVIALACGHFFEARRVRLFGALRWALLMALLVCVQDLAVRRPLSGVPAYGNRALGGAVSFLDLNRVRGRMFNDPGSGDLLIGAGARPVFVDSRDDLYEGRFLRDARQWPFRFRQLSDVYGFDYAVLLNRRFGYPARALDEDPDWRLAYADDEALVYIRRDGVDGPLVEGGRIALLRPNALWPDVMDSALADPRRAPAVLAELDRWLLLAPDSRQALLWKAYALNRLGLSGRARRLAALAAKGERVRRDPELSALLAFDLRQFGPRSAAGRAFLRARWLAWRRGEGGLAAEIRAREAP